MYGSILEELGKLDKLKELSWPTTAGGENSQRVWSMVTLGPFKIQNIIFSPFEIMDSMNSGQVPVFDYDKSEEEKTSIKILNVIKTRSRYNLKIEMENKI